MADLIGMLRSRLHVPTTFAIREIARVAEDNWTLRIKCALPDFRADEMWWTTGYVTVSAKLYDENKKLRLERYAPLVFAPSSQKEMEALRARLVMHSRSIVSRTSVDIVEQGVGAYIQFYLRADINSDVDLSVEVERLCDKLLPRFVTECNDFEFFLNAGALGCSPLAKGSA